MGHDRVPEIFLTLGGLLGSEKVPDDGLSGCVAFAVASLQAVPHNSGTTEALNFVWGLRFRIQGLGLLDQGTRLSPSR